MDHRAARESQEDMLLNEADEDDLLVESNDEEDYGNKAQNVVRLVAVDEFEEWR